MWRQAEAGAGHEPGGGDAIILRGEQATEAAFRAAAVGRRVLHLATHGFALNGDCSDPEIGGLRGIGGLAPAGAATPPETPGTIETPSERPPAEDASATVNLGMLTGLAVAGANQRDVAVGNADDGILTAEEISGLDLDGVEWVVLSACDTGGGEIRPGEGVIGLQRAFRIAGAHTVIMSLWAVEDESARIFMEALYRARFSDGRTAPEAMHAAGRAVLTSRRNRGRSTHPIFWAGFVATGDWS